ncbi:hypothetical protein ABZ863_22405 [Saccharomonospora sp. NPDC046836]|uniref:hypothetical protein n=1 Tax=Saccharomonospora sp. NPDC046836 TaxID=3156921 RepID=UPI0033FBD924
MKITKLWGLLTILFLTGGLLGAPAATAQPSTNVLSEAYVVYDRATERYVVTKGADAQYRSASVVKLLIALDHLYQNDPALVLEEATTEAERNDILALRAMLRSSWDYAASSFWVRNGYTEIIDRMVARIGLQHTLPPEDEGIWGYTVVSPSDVVRIYNHILDEAPQRYRDFIMTNLRLAENCGEDGFDQSFGILSVFREPRSAKQGWSGWGSAPAEGEECSPATLARSLEAGPVDATKEDPVDFSNPLLATTGTVGKQDRAVVVVFMTFVKGTTHAEGSAQITRRTQRLALL